MERLYPKRTVPPLEWSSQTLPSISAPPLPLVAVFAIVIFLLSVSQYTTYKSQLQSTANGFQLILFLLPILLVFVMVSGLTSASISGIRAFRAYHHRPPASNRGITGGGSGGGGIGGSPLGVGILVVILLVLVSYQSSFHSKWSD